MLMKQELKCKCLELAINHCVLNDKDRTGLKIQHTPEDVIEYAKKFEKYIASEPASKA